MEGINACYLPSWFIPGGTLDCSTEYTGMARLLAEAGGTDDELRRLD